MNKIIEIGSEAHMKILLLKKIRNHQNTRNSIFIKNKKSFKVYVYFVKTKSIHTYSKHKQVHKKILHEKQVTLG